WRSCGWVLWARITSERPAHGAGPDFGGELYALAPAANERAIFSRYVGQERYLLRTRERQRPASRTESAACSSIATSSGSSSRSSSPCTPYFAASRARSCWSSPATSSTATGIGASSG